MSLKEALAGLKAETKVLQKRKSVVTRLNELVRRLDAAMLEANPGHIEPTPKLEFDGISCLWDLVERGRSPVKLHLVVGRVNHYLRIRVAGVRFDFHRTSDIAHSTSNETAAELLIEVLEKNLEKVVDTEEESG